MTHVDAHNDQNVKIWPGGMPLKRRARFLMVILWVESICRRLLQHLERPEYPGLVEELMTPDGGSLWADRSI